MIFIDLICIVHFLTVRRVEGQRLQEIRQEQPLPGLLQRRTGEVPLIHPALHRYPTDDAGIQLEERPFLGHATRLPHGASRRDVRRLDQARLHNEVQRAESRRVPGLHHQFSLRYGANKAETRVF